MENSSTYVFDVESQEQLKEKTFKDIDDEKTLKELDRFKTTIDNLIKGSQKDGICNRGFVITVNGAWGAGKSTATWALINEIKVNITNPVIIDRSLLPFGNVSESISTFLNDLSRRMRDENLIDINNEISQFILESTPNSERTGITANFGPVSISKEFSSNRGALNTQNLITKFKKLKDKSTVIIILDDLDRLRPNEIVDVLRMVEKLRLLPNVIILLPIYKKIINKAIAKDLSLDESSASTFLRKLTDAEIYIDNEINDLKNTFCNTLSKLLDSNDIVRNWGVGNKIEAIKLSDLIWYLLLHIVVVHESLNIVNNIQPNEATDSKIVFNEDKSSYLRSMVSLFQSSVYKNNQTNSNYPYPIFENRGGQKLLTSIGERWRGIRDRNDRGWVNELNSLISWENSASVVTTDDSIVNQLKTQNSVPFTDEVSTKETASKIPIFIYAFMPLLQKTNNEPLLTSNYKRRDMNLLARQIEQELKGQNIPHRDEDAMHLLYELVRSKYNRFRG